MPSAASASAPRASFVAVAAVQHDMRAGATEAARNREAEPRPAARDERARTRKIEGIAASAHSAQHC